MNPTITIFWGHLRIAAQTTFSYYSGLLILLVITLGACSSTNTTKTESDYLLYPAPPDEPRIQFLTSFSNEDEFSGKSSGGFLETVLGEEQQRRAILRPYGIALHNDRLIMCDSRLDGLILADLDTRSIEHYLPTGFGKMGLPLNVDIDTSGNVYVADTKRKQVLMFSKDLDLLETFGDPETGKPVDVQRVGDELWVLDMEQKRIDIYNAGNKNLLRSFPDRKGEDDPQNFYNPANMKVTADRVYVSDLGDARIKYYDHQGNFINAYGGSGTTIGKFARPKGLDVDREGNVYVVDAAFENVQVFNAEDELLMFFGNANTNRDLYLPAGILIDYEHNERYQEFVLPGYELEYLIFVTNQYGSRKVHVYGFIKPKTE